MTKTLVRISRIRKRLGQIPGEMAVEVERMVGLREMCRGCQRRFEMTLSSPV